MITLPDTGRAWEYENGFYLTCDTTRISKALAHYELFKMTAGLAGAIVECGVFKGVSLARFAMFRELLSNPLGKKIIAFDTFELFPETEHSADQAPRARFVREAGAESISAEQMMHVLAAKGCQRAVECVAGDICKTVPEYVQKNPHLRICLLNLDTDVYEPAVTILKHLYPRIVTGGVLILDDYGVFPGETQAVDEFFAAKGIKIQKFPFCMTPCYVVKE